MLLPATRVRRLNGPLSWFESPPYQHDHSERVPRSDITASVIEFQKIQGERDGYVPCHEGPAGDYAAAVLPSSRLEGCKEDVSRWLCNACPDDVQGGGL